MGTAQIRRGTLHDIIAALEDERYTGEDTKMRLIAALGEQQNALAHAMTCNQNMITMIQTHFTQLSNALGSVTGESAPVESQFSRVQ